MVAGSTATVLQALSAPITSGRLLRQWGRDTIVLFERVQSSSHAEGWAYFLVWEYTSVLHIRYGAVSILRDYVRIRTGQPSR